MSEPQACACERCHGPILEARYRTDEQQVCDFCDEAFCDACVACGKSCEACGLWYCGDCNCLVSCDYPGCNHLYCDECAIEFPTYSLCRNCDHVYCSEHFSAECAECHRGLCRYCSEHVCRFRKCTSCCNFLRPCAQCAVLARVRPITYKRKRLPR